MAEATQMKVSDEIAITITNMNKWYGTCLLYTSDAADDLA